MKAELKKGQMKAEMKMCLISKYWTSYHKEESEIFNLISDTPLIPSEISRENARAWFSMDFK